MHTLLTLTSISMRRRTAMLATLDEVGSSLETEFRTFAPQNNACADAFHCFYVIGARDCSCHMRGIGLRER
jgi:hypothetical protein